MALKSPCLSRLPAWLKLKELRTPVEGTRSAGSSRALTRRDIWIDRIAQSRIVYTTTLFRGSACLPFFGSLPLDRKSTRLNSSHLGMSYAVFCLKIKRENRNEEQRRGNAS